MNTKWTEAYNRLWEIINTGGDTYYSGSKLLDIAREVDYSIPQYRLYIEERKRKELSTSRKEFFSDVLQALSEENRLHVYRRIIETVKEYEPEKTQQIIELLSIESKIGSLPTGLSNEIESCKIDSIHIENFYGFKELDMNDLRDKSFIFILGENGSGKTIFQKALLIKLKEFYLNEVSKKDFGIFEEELNNNPDFFISLKTVHGENEIDFNTKNKHYLKNCFAYGTNRNKISDTSQGEPYGFLTLFRDSEYLTNAEEWIKEIERQSLKGETTIGISDIEELLIDILELPKLNIKIGGKDVFFTIDEQRLQLAQFSEGYRSVLLLVIDLVARLVAYSPGKNIREAEAVVLIDELDLFLHPVWEKNICAKLHNWFPNIQFFVTTHSPVLIDGAVRAPKLANKIKVYRFIKQGSNTEIKEAYEGEDIKNWLPNILLSSQLFDPNYLDDISEDDIVKTRTENSRTEMLETEEYIQRLKELESQIKSKYIQQLNKDRDD